MSKLFPLIGAILDLELRLNLNTDLFNDPLRNIKQIVSLPKALNLWPL